MQSYSFVTLYYCICFLVRAFRRDVFNALPFNAELYLIRSSYTVLVTLTSAISFCATVDLYVGRGDSIC